MSLTIKERNLCDLIDPDVALAITHIDWDAGPLVKAVLDQFPNVNSLDCSNNDFRLEERQQLQPYQSYLLRLFGIYIPISIIRLYLPAFIGCYLTIPSLQPVNCFSACAHIKRLDLSKSSISSLKEIGVCLELEDLDCSNCYLKSLEGISLCLNLKRLVCRSNFIWSLEPLRGCSSLEVLDCSECSIHSLAGIEYTPKLLELYCSDNNLHRSQLKGLECTSNLVRLYCNGCRIRTFENLCLCLNLRILHCSHGVLKYLDGIQGCLGLTDLYINSNKVVSIEQLAGLHRLERLNISGNKIAKLDRLTHLGSLRYLQVHNNPIVTQTQQVLHFLDMFKQGGYRKTASVTPSTDIRQSVQNLLTDAEPEFSFDMLTSSGMSESVVMLLMEYCHDPTVHPCLLTYQELLAYVWQRIECSMYKPALIKLLGEMIVDQCMYEPAVRFNQTVSVLVGYYPDITLED